MRCDENGFASQFEIYSQKIENTVEKNLNKKVVMRLNVVFYRKIHRLFIDNYLTSYNLFKFLETKNFTWHIYWTCSTVNMSCKQLPKNLSDDNLLERRNFDCAASIVCLKRKNKKSVHILSSLENPTDEIIIERKERDNKI